ncbi:hypothetical protein OHB12_16785 [Nocardia sp. NBC_01730]|uniref:hypothetical protein n=1 Tax=Nocardia sp. NBC_01730 TaxID=2975998 RepID=UPI002E1218B4|nr:hypothetical protein OHB12_16785 [Nocardia sp. NBC_01730]
MATSSDLDVSFAGDELVLRLAGLARLARFSAVSRPRTKSELRLFLLVHRPPHLLTRDTAYPVL